MADQKRWFKVWTSILTDPDHSDLSLEDVGRWTRLGALVVQVGERGQLRISPPAKVLCTLFGAVDFDDLRTVLERLPNVSVSDAPNRHGLSGGHSSQKPEKSVNGAFAVTLANWTKYQEDSTVAERQRRSRAKRRGEVKERETRKRVTAETRPTGPVAVPSERRVAELGPDGKYPAAAMGLRTATGELLDRVLMYRATSRAWYHAETECGRSDPCVKARFARLVPYASPCEVHRAEYEAAGV